MGSETTSKVATTAISLKITSYTSPGGNKAALETLTRADDII
jgi:hypothetical protein